MARGSTTAAHRLHTVVTDAIDAVADPGEARDILAEALTSAGLPALPSEPDALGVFVSRWLHVSLQRRIGDDAANLVGAELTRVLDSIVASERVMDGYSTGVRARRSWPVTEASESSRPTVPALAEDAGRTPVVVPFSRRAILVATSDPRAAVEFGRLEDEFTRVVIVANAHELVVAASSLDVRDPILVLDGAWPTVPAVMLATSRLDLPPRTRVVLFRYDARLVETLRSFAPVTARWDVIRRGARAVDLLAYVTNTWC